MSCNCEETCCFISYGCVIDNTPLNTFADEEEIEKSIVLAQKDIKKEIQKDCYDKICQAIKDSPGTPIPSEIQKAIDLLTLPLAWKTFSYWLKWYSTTTFGDSATTTVTDRDSNNLANVDNNRRKQMILDADSEYESFLNDAMIEFKELDLGCYKDPNECKPCKKSNTSEFDYLPDVV